MIWRRFGSHHSRSQHVRSNSEVPLQSIEQRIRVWGHHKWPEIAADLGAQQILVYNDSAVPFLICLQPHQARAGLLEIHEDLCGGHPAARSLALKVGRQDYFWPNILQDAKELVMNCDKCQ